jgi:hypothetical protein
MGDYSEEQIHSADGAFIGIPNPRILHDRIKNIRQKTEIQVAGVKFHPFLSLLVKSEMYPLGAVVETASTLILIVAWIKVALLVSSGWAVAFVGGVALFTGSSMFHFWYGKWQLR